MTGCLGAGKRSWEPHRTSKHLPLAGFLCAGTYGGGIEILGRTKVGQLIPIDGAGSYNARNSSKGALVIEAGNLVGGLRSGLSVADLRRRALDGALLPQRSRRTRELIWRALRQRYIAGQPEWVLADLQSAYDKGVHSREFLSLLYLHYALRDPLMFDFVTRVVWERWRERRRDVSRADALALLDQAGETQPHARRWTESTRLKLAGNVLSALRDFGLLNGRQKKTVVRPVLPLTTAEHIVRLLIEAGARGAEVVRHPVWRLFLLREEDVADLLHRLAQERKIRFERAGDTVVLQPPAEWGAS